MRFISRNFSEFSKLKTLTAASLFLALGAFLGLPQAALANNAFNASKTAGFYNNLPSAQENTAKTELSNMVKNGEGSEAQPVLLVRSPESSNLSFAVANPGRNGQEIHAIEQSGGQQFLYDKVAAQVPLKVKVIHMRGEAPQIWLEPAN